MRKLFQIMLFAAVVLAVSCSGGSKKSKESCPDGYELSGGDCVKVNGGDIGDSTVSDTDSQPDDGDTADDTDQDDGDTGGDNDPDGDGYTGSCKVIRSGDSLEINIETKKLKIGSFKIKDEVAADDELYGELWAENKETLSEFKVGDISSELSGKEFNFPKGKYDFAYRPVFSANNIVIAENIDMASGDRTLDFNLPLFHLKGKVVNNDDAVFTVEESYQAETKLTLKSGTFEKEIPYSEFASYDIVLPKGVYSVYFEGQLAAGQGKFEGTVLPATAANSEDPSAKSGIEIGGDSANVEKDIKIATVTFAGSIAQGGFAVTSGQLVLVENPPFGAVSGVVAADLSASSYSITATTGADLSLVYLPAADSYPARYIKIGEAWNDKMTNPAANNITLDFGRIHGKITFLGGKNFPTVSKCEEADCTIGKLKAVGGIDDSSSYTVKDLGVELATDDNGDVTYEALLVRRRGDVSGDGTTQYTKKTYTMKFESFLNDVTGIFSAVPFSVEARANVFKGTVEELNEAGEIVAVEKFETSSSFSFDQTNVAFVLDDDGHIVKDENGVAQTTTTIQWSAERELDFDIAPSNIKGMITLNESPYSTTKPDFIRLKDEYGTEYSVVNLSEISGGMFSFFAPAGTYSVIYDGEGVLSRNFKTYIERDFEIIENENQGNAIFAMKTGKIILDLNVNETPFAKWAEEQESLNAIGLAVNIDKTATDFVLELSKNSEGKYAAETLLGSTVNAYLELAFSDKIDSEKSFTRIPLLSSHNMTSGKTVSKDLSLVDADISVKLNGSAVSASDYAAVFRIRGTNSSEIYCPASSAVTAFFQQGEYKNPLPELSLNGGFETKQDIAVPCVYFSK